MYNFKVFSIQLTYKFVKQMYKIKKFILQCSNFMYYNKLYKINIHIIIIVNILNIYFLFMGVPTTRTYFLNFVPNVSILYQCLMYNISQNI